MFHIYELAVFFTNGDEMLKLLFCKIFITTYVPQKNILISWWFTYILCWNNNNLEIKIIQSFCSIYKLDSTVTYILFLLHFDIQVVNVTSQFLYKMIKCLIKPERSMPHKFHNTFFVPILRNNSVIIFGFIYTYI